MDWTRRSTVAALVTTLALSGCSAVAGHGASAAPGSRPPGSSAPTATASSAPGAVGPQAFGPGPFTAQTLDLDVRALARAGIATFDSPRSTTPLVAVTAPASPLRLVRNQVAELGAEAAANAGVAGPTLDAVFSRMIGTAVPITAILSAYMQSKHATIARIAPALAAQDPRQPIVPAIVLVAFVSDLARSAPAAGSHFAPLDAAAPRASAPTGLCAQAKAFLDQTIAAVFEGLHIDSIDTSNWPGSLKWFGGALNGVIGIFDAILTGAQFVVVNGERLILAPFIDLMTKLAAAATVVTDVLTFIRPLAYQWSLTPTAHPEFGVEGQPPLSWTDTLTVTTQGPTDWPDELKSCADVAGVTLPALGLGGSKVDWNPVRPAGWLTVTSADPALTGQPDGSGRARVTVQTGQEPREWHDRGQPHQQNVLVEGTVHRNSALIVDAVSSAVSALFSLVPEFLRAKVAATVTGLITPLVGKIGKLSDVAVGVWIYVTYHSAPEPTAPTQPSSAPSSTSCTPVGPLNLAAGTYRGQFHFSGSFGPFSRKATGTLELIVAESGAVSGSWSGDLETTSPRTGTTNFHEGAGTVRVVRLPAGTGVQLTGADTPPWATFVIASKGCSDAAGTEFSILGEQGSWAGTRS